MGRHILQGLHPTQETDQAITGVLPPTMEVVHCIQEGTQLTLEVVQHTTEVAPPTPPTTWATLASRATNTLPITPLAPLHFPISLLER